MGTCKECRWWGTEQLFVPDNGMRECLNPNLKARGICEPGDGFGKVNDVATSAGFGCNQFEERA